jgi:hypothetical protein
LNFGSLALATGNQHHGVPSLGSDLALIERARATFARARKSHGEIRSALAELRDHVRTLAQYSASSRVR